MSLMISEDDNFFDLRIDFVVSLLRLVTCTFWGGMDLAREDFGLDPEGFFLVPDFLLRPRAGGDSDSSI
jgi:hypothetical protein